jgi:catechol 2,3-dioxygenase-like lactoylglutathione lyase family enzyme
MERPTHAGLRHLALNVRDLPAMKRFYVELLGFSVEWEPDSDNIYLSSGIDNLALHRSTALTTGRSTALTTGRSTSLTAGRSTELTTGRSTELTTGRTGESNGAGALDHLGLIVRQAADVDRWAAYLEGNGVVMSAKPKTHRDGARSCYFHDPDGNSVQIIHHPPISQKT